MNRLVQSVLHPIETFRTAPYGFSVMTGGGLLATDAINLEPAAIDPFIDGLGIAAFAASTLLIARQFRMRSRFEQTLDENGYDDRYFAYTTREWCVRQTAKVVCENAGVEAEFNDLIAKKRERGELDLAWIPNI